jgi:hypothetical protein
MWPEATETDVRFHVGDRSKSGLGVLNVSFAESDPYRKCCLSRLTVMCGSGVRNLGLAEA